MSIKKSHKLLPCPFCGSSDVVIDQTNSEDDVYNRKNGCMSSRYYAYCFGCFTESNKFRTSIGAIKAWNKRIDNTP